MRRLKIFITGTFLLLLSCSSNQYVNTSFIGKTYVKESRWGGRDTITFLPNNVFYIKLTPCGFLSEFCEREEGRWYLKGDSLYLTTLFQNKLNNYFIETGSQIANDSIKLVVYSIKSGLPSKELDILNGNGDVFAIDSNGNMILPCSAIPLVKRYINLYLHAVSGLEDTIQISCGKEYRYNINDCFYLIMYNTKFILRDSFLIDDSGFRYHQISNENNSGLNTSAIVR